METLLNFSLRELYRHPSPKRAKRAVLRLRRLLSKRFHIAEENVYISQRLNELIWAKGFSKVPRVVALRIVVEDGKLKTYLQDEKIEAPKKKEEKKAKEAPKEEKEAKKAKVSEKKPVEEKRQAAKTEKETSDDKSKAKKLEEKRLKEKAAEKAAIKRKLDK